MGNQMKLKINMFSHEVLKIFLFLEYNSVNYLLNLKILNIL